MAARVKLCQLKETDNEFWMELTTRLPEDCIPDENILQPEDSLAEDTDGLLDDSDIPIRIVVETIAGTWSQGGEDCREGYKVVGGGILVADTLAEEFDDKEVIKPIDVDDGDKDLGCGK